MAVYSFGFGFIPGRIKCGFKFATQQRTSRILAYNENTLTGTKSDGCVLRVGRGCLRLPLFNPVTREKARI